MNRKSAFSIGMVCVLVLAALALAEKAPEIPPGTNVRVRIIDNLSSDLAKIGDAFHGTLDEAITVDGRQVYPKGADVDGRVVDVHTSGRLSEPGELDLILSTVSSGARMSSLHVQPLVVKGESHGKSNTTKIGGGAALGAIIGGIVGGGKGAAVGAGAGAAAGTGAAAATGKREAQVESEAVLTFVTVSPTEVRGNGDSASSTSAASTPAASTPESSSASSSSSSASSSTSGSDDSLLFTLRDRRVIRTCLSEHASQLPPGTTQLAELPSGAERELHRDGTVPAEIEKKVQPLPLACVNQLNNLPGNYERVVYAGHVMLINSSNRILDIFDLD